MWKVALKKSVKNRLERIPNPDKERIKQAIRDLAEKPETLDIKPLKGRDGYRLRVGGWRLIMDVCRDERIFAVHTLESRGDVYKK
ncbi:MAG: type II toxin-antitoxin system RelE/ParE family toxin [Synergistaceae bacterium]|nr:type II toxin-antitoxin system RelE/ParE family toxin [Synergistaceae bacterium]